MGARFEPVKRFENKNITMPRRATAESAGYDLYVAEDTLIPPYNFLKQEMLYTSYDKGIDPEEPKDLTELAAAVKNANAKVTLVSTGVRCKLDSGTYLKIVARSSLPLKHWIVVANSEGIIDADYYRNETSDGEIFFQLINLSPFPVILKKGDCIGQGIIQTYLKTEDDAATGERKGGLGSTSK